MARKRPRIADNPSIAGLRRDLKGVKALMKLRPLLRLFGVRLDDSIAQRANELDRHLQDLGTLPDRFNDRAVLPSAARERVGRPSL